ncbi:DUF485 domain-containing protein [Elioraea sp.]|uniref:DUF485 domain-containing protein n=1 Tax=Elioraea sp. TaxID=2185103 RepID=UPI0025C431B3|nr:DUF485 domain-containing protein [Elioraea sp.]
MHRDDGRAEALVRRLTTARLKVAAVLTACMVVAYFGFVGLVAFAKPAMGTLIVPGLSVGILLGALVIVSAWVLTFIYVRWANGTYDRRVADAIRRGA